MKYTNLIVERSGNIAKIAINRPKVLNALNQKTRLELMSAISELDKEDEIHAIVLKGTGDRAFSAGQDLGESKNFSGDRAKTWVEEYHRLYDNIMNTTKPIVASINGYCIGAGLQIALLADLRLCSENSKFAFTEIDIGIPTITGTGTMWYVTSISNMKELILTGDIVDAQRAKEMGIVNRIVAMEDLEGATLELAEKLANKPRIAMELNKSCSQK